MVEELPLLLKLSAVSELVGLSPGEVKALVKSGKFPAPLDLPTPFWRTAEVLAWEPSYSTTPPPPRKPRKLKSPRVSVRRGGGVTLSRGRWRARVWLEGRMYHLAVYATQEEARRAADLALALVAQRKGVEEIREAVRSVNHSG